jgi:predicted dehydrogenase
MNKQYRVAVIGAGGMGAGHAQRWQMHANAQLVAVLDPRRSAARTINAPHFLSWQRLLARTQPDIIDICTPTFAHRTFIELAAQAGKAIFVEKPLAATLDDCDACIKSLQQSGVAAMAAHVVRYFPEFLRARQLVQAGIVGNPVMVRTARMAGFPFAARKNNWYADFGRSGGVVLDMLVHDFDWLRWTFGEVERVYARGLRAPVSDRGPLDYALVSLRLRSGVIAHVTGSWAHTAGFRTTLEIAGDKATLEHDSATTVPLAIANRVASTGKRTAGGVAVPESPLAPPDDPYFLEQRAFLAALDTGSTPPITLEDAREAVRIALAAIESITSGKVVEL